MYTFYYNSLRPISKQSCSAYTEKLFGLYIKVRSTTLLFTKCAAYSSSGYAFLITMFNVHLFNDTIEYTHKYHQFILCTDMSSGMIYCALVRHFRMVPIFAVEYWSR